MFGPRVSLMQALAWQFFFCCTQARETRDVKKLAGHLGNATWFFAEKK
jgi:hypothetical protein